MSTRPTVIEMLDGFQLKEWKNRLRELLRAHGQTQWEIGDILIEGEDQGKLMEADLKRYALTATQYRWAWKTLRNFKVTARAIPPSRRRDGKDGRPELSYSMHVEIAKFEDPEIQERLLEMASTARSLALGKDHMEAARFKAHDGDGFSYHVSVPLSVLDLKTRIREMQKKGELPKTKEKVSAPPEPTQTQPWKCTSVMPVKFTRTHHQFLMAVVSGRGGYGPHGARTLVCKIVCDYIQQNLPTLMEDAKKHDARWGSLRPELSRILSQEKSPEVAPPPPSPAKLKREAAEAKKRAEAQAEQAEKDCMAKEEGRPTRVQFQGYTARCAKLSREALSKAGQGTPGLLMSYMRKIFGVDFISPETTSIFLWESTLAKLESASSPEALVEILKS